MDLRRLSSGRRWRIDHGCEASADDRLRIRLGRHTLRTAVVSSRRLQRHSARGGLRRCRKDRLAAQIQRPDGAIFGLLSRGFVPARRQRPPDFGPDGVCHRHHAALAVAAPRRLPPRARLRRLPPTVACLRDDEADGRLRRGPVQEGRRGITRRAGAGRARSEQEGRGEGASVADRGPVGIPSGKAAHLVPQRLHERARRQGAPDSDFCARHRSVGRGCRRLLPVVLAEPHRLHGPLPEMSAAAVGRMGWKRRNSSDANAHAGAGGDAASSSATAFGTPAMSRAIQACRTLKSDTVLCTLEQILERLDPYDYQRIEFVLDRMLEAHAALESDSSMESSDTTRAATTAIPLRSRDSNERDKKLIVFLKSYRRISPVGDGENAAPGSTSRLRRCSCGPVAVPPARRQGPLARHFTGAQRRHRRRLDSDSSAARTRGRSDLHDGAAQHRQGSCPTTFVSQRQRRAPKIVTGRRVPACLGRVERRSRLR